MTYQICDLNGACDRNYSDQDFYNNFQIGGGIRLDANDIYQNGTLIGTWERLSFDDLGMLGNAFFLDMSARRDASNHFTGAFAVGSALAGGGLAASGAIDFLATVPEDYSVLGPHRAFNLLQKVTNTKLRNIIKDLYRVTAKVGDGGTVDSVTYTRETGSLVGGTDHIEKAMGYARGLANVLKNPSLSATEREIGKHPMNTTSPQGVDGRIVVA